MNILGELRRRNVIRMPGLYLVGATADYAYRLSGGKSGRKDAIDARS